MQKITKKRNKYIKIHTKKKYNYDKAKANTKTNTKTKTYVKTKAKVQSQLIYQSYPLYKKMYNFNVSRIIDIVKNMKSQLYIYTKSPPNYKNYPSHKFKTLQLNKAQHTGNIHKYYIIKSSWNDNLELNKITDYFTEPCRIKCTFKKNMSPLNYWNRNWKSILAPVQKQQQKNQFVLKYQHKSSTPASASAVSAPAVSAPALSASASLIHALREAMYIRNKPCNNFRISVCLEVLKIFKPTKWLDISAGWGDRLLSALLCPSIQTYCGIDPNPCLHPYYKEMILKFDPDGKKDCILIQDGFETAKLPNIQFDFVFSSPPFFDLEIYSNAKSNSLVKYKGEDAWFNGFLIPSLYKAYDYLEAGGYFILYMGESHGTKYIPKMITLMDSRMQNAGMFYYTDGVKIREFFCWKKE